MALSIKTDEADRLARRLSKLTGETLTEAVTKALRERLERERARRSGGDDLRARVNELLQRFRPAYDARPVTRGEWDAASGEDG
jgi:antitoxin VapB